MSKYKFSSTVLVFLAFVVPFILGPVLQSERLSLMPGDLGDARLNNYFLENIYLFFSGESKSLWHLNFFTPAPYVLGFSDNLFGSSPAYLIPRLLLGEADTAFQIWYLIGFAVNFVAAYFSMRMLGRESIGSAVGAIIFTFALPVTANAGHAQLHYRFGAALAITYFLIFLQNKSWPDLIKSMAWLVWQFYCTIYIGFFASLLMAAMLAFKYYRSKIDLKKGILFNTGIWLNKWSEQPRQFKIKQIFALFTLVVFVMVLFFPYLKIKAIYGTHRSFSEISTMLPRLQSYVISDGSIIWKSYSSLISGVPARLEQQMFSGALPILLSLHGIYWSRKNKTESTASLLLFSTLICMVITLQIGSFTLWRFFSLFPIASAIRAVARIELIFLFPVAYFSAFAIDSICRTKSLSSYLIATTLVFATIAESAATEVSMSSKQSWRERTSSKQLPPVKEIRPDSILFYPQTTDNYIYDEVDAMVVAQRNHLGTLNGYSGAWPHGFSLNFGTKCIELPKRVISILMLTNKTINEIEYRSAMEKIIPIGFSDCNSTWWENAPNTSSDAKPYSSEQFRGLSYELITVRKKDSDTYSIGLRVINSGNIAIKSTPFSKNPISLSWRFIDENGEFQSGWDSRKELPNEIPAHGHLDLELKIEPPKKGNWRVQVSMVQEMVFWAHEIGIAPIYIALK
jgi:hypothetical protein